MKLRQMEVFHAIMTAGTVTAAARLLNISQPAVTALLRHTEDQLSFRLFDRVKGRLQPTLEAHALFDEVERVFESVRAVRRIAEDLREVRSGVLSIVTTPSLGVVTLPRAVTSFLEGRPKVRIRLQVRRRNEAIEMVASRSVDLGFTFLAAHHPNNTIRDLAHGRLVCIMPHGHPLAELDEVSSHDIVKYPLITYTHTQGLSPLIDAAFVEARVAGKSSVEVGLVSTAWSLVQDGAGVALVDEFSKMEEIYPRVVMRPFVPHKPITLELLRPSKQPLSALAQKFVEHTTQALHPMATVSMGMPDDIMRAQRPKYG